MGMAYITATLLFGVAIYFVARFFIKTSRQFSGARVVICPESGKQAMVEIDARRAAFNSLVGQADLRLENCWRWPLQQNCGQDCLPQLHLSEDEGVRHGVLTSWYRGKRCVFCERQFAEVDLRNHQPALFTPDGVTVEITEIPINELKEAIATYEPVCGSCHLAQTFYHEQPDLVVERPVM